MRPSRCSLESSPPEAAAVPLHRSDGGPDRSPGMKERSSVGGGGSSSRGLAAAAAACLAISTVSSAGASAFVVSPLHESAGGPHRITRGSRRVGKPHRPPGGDDNAAVLSSPPSEEHRRTPTSLIMAVTDPETLLGKDFASAYSSRILQPGTSIYFVPEKISSQVEIELQQERRRSRSPVSLGRKEKKTVSSAVDDDDDAAAAAARLAPHVQQIIESELEVVEADEEAAARPAAVVDVAAVTEAAAGPARAFKPVSSTPAGHKRSVEARRKRRSSSEPVLPKRGATATKAKATLARTATDTESGSGSRSSRSSTMPGFAGRKTSGRYRAYRDGIKIAEERSGKDIEKVLKADADRVKDRRKANSEAMYKSSASVPDSLIAYTNEIHEKTERITPTEEIELGTKTQEAIRLQNLYDNLEIELNREPTDDEWCAAAGKINVEALRAAIEDGMDAKNRLVEANLRMVQGVVNLYIRNGLGSQYNAGDLMQEGTMALIRAAEKFEPERGFRFSTYAMYWIRSAVKRSQILQSRIIQVPQRLHETHKRVLKVEKELKGELGRKPTKEELALASNLSEVQLERCLAAMAQECFSLDATLKNSRRTGSGADRKETMIEVVNDKLQDEGYQKMQQQLMKDSLINSLRRVLTPHEVDLLLLRYGLMDERTLPHGFAGPLTIAEVSRLVGLKPDKVRRMINKCLSKLRSLIAHEWEDYENELS